MVTLPTSKDQTVVALKAYAVGLFSLLMIFIADQTKLIYYPKSLLSYLFINLDQFTYAKLAVFQLPFKYLAYTQNGLDRIADLEHRLSQTAIDHQRLFELEAKTASLEAMLVATPINHQAAKLVKLIYQNHQLIINAGLNEGISLGQVVTDSRGIFIGKVKAVNHFFSQVTITSDKNSSLTVKTHANTAKGILIGDGESTILTGVLSSEPLAVGELIVLDEQNTDSPLNLIIGQVAKLTHQPSDATKTALVDPLYQLEGFGAVW